MASFEEIKAFLGFGTGKCAMCRVKFGPNDVPKNIQDANRAWKVVCKLCYKTMGGAPRTNILGDADHASAKKKGVNTGKYFG